MDLRHVHPDGWFALALPTQCPVLPSAETGVMEQSAANHSNSSATSNKWTKNGLTEAMINMKKEPSLIVKKLW